MNPRPATPQLCERCFRPIHTDQPHAKLGHATGTTLNGEIIWRYTYLHPYTRGGCATGTTTADPT